METDVNPVLGIILIALLVINICLTCLLFKKQPIIIAINTEPPRVEPF